MKGLQTVSVTFVACPGKENLVEEMGRKRDSPFFSKMTRTIIKNQHYLVVKHHSSLINFHIVYVTLLLLLTFEGAEL